LDGDAGTTRFHCRSDSLSPCQWITYLDRRRGLGVSERYIEMERDTWIMIAALMPHLIDLVIAKKHQDLDDPTW
jgi:hypothetical protein